MYQGYSNYQHQETETLGILITNLGTPDQPTPQALRRYLAEFLWDPRVVEVSRPLWWLILNLIILNTRPKKSAQAYQKIWQPEGSPLLTISEQQKEKLNQVLNNQLTFPYHIALGMRYGNPSIKQALDVLQQKHITKLLVLPLYPQYSAATVGSTFDRVTDIVKTWRWVPEFSFINHYHDNDLYIKALASHIQKYLPEIPQKLIFSFHGLPKRYLLEGDPYFCQCHKTARLVAESLGLQENQWQVAFQSRFGKEEWLKPYTDYLLQALPKQGVKDIAIICPGFAADCLETLEEIAEENKNYFLQAGGEKYQYIPALNAEDSHIAVLKNLIIEYINPWIKTSSEAIETKLARFNKILEIDK